MSIDMSALPNLPGYTLAPRKTGNHGRTQGFGYIRGVPMVLREPGQPRDDKPKFVKVPKAGDTWKQGSFPEATSRDIFKAPNPSEFDELPAWDALDRHVLRFFGYFKEAVPESNMENYRVRRAIIYYYLEDDTMHITEPRIDNSGIPQGTLIRRHRFPGPSGERLKPEELTVGMDLNVYGKNIRVTDCDAFTRAYFQQLDPPVMQADALPVPGDAFQENLKGAMNADPALKRNYEKLYREMMLGGGHINADMQQFMENDRKVCRFFATMDDLMTAQYECRPFTLLYFLADDTVEIREQYPLNCGRDNFPIYFRRGKVRKGNFECVGPGAGRERLGAHRGLLRRDAHHAPEQGVLRVRCGRLHAPVLRGRHGREARGQDRRAPPGARGAAAADAGLHRLRELGRLDGLRDEPHPEGSAQRLPQAHVQQQQDPALHGEVREPEAGGRAAPLRLQLLHVGRHHVHPRAAAAQPGHHHGQVPGEGGALEPEDGPPLRAEGLPAGQHRPGDELGVRDDGDGRVHAEVPVGGAPGCHVRPAGGAGEAPRGDAPAGPERDDHLPQVRQGPQRRDHRGGDARGAAEVRLPDVRRGVHHHHAALRPPPGRADLVQRVCGCAARRGLPGGVQGLPGPRPAQAPGRRVCGAREVQDAAARRSGEDPPRGARDHGRGVQARRAHEQAHEGVQRDDAPEDRGGRDGPRGAAAPGAVLRPRGHRALRDVRAPGRGPLADPVLRAPAGPQHGLPRPALHSLGASRVVRGSLPCAGSAISEQQNSFGLCLLRPTGGRQLRPQRRRSTFDGSRVHSPRRLAVRRAPVRLRVCLDTGASPFSGRAGFSASSGGSDGGAWGEAQASHWTEART